MNRDQLKFMLFDLDGTLVDSVPDLQLSLNYVLSDLGLASVSEADVRDWVGNGAALLIQRALQHAASSAVDDALFQQASSLFYRYYQQNLDVGTRVYAGAHELLSALRALNVSCACITNKPRCFTEPLLSRMQLQNYFKALACGDDFASKKPHPQPLLEVMQQLDVHRTHGFMVGDSASDMEAATRAGVRAIMVSYGYNQGFVASDPNILQVHSLAEVLSHIQSMA